MVQVHSAVPNLGVIAEFDSLAPRQHFTQDKKLNHKFPKLQLSKALFCDNRLIGMNLEEAYSLPGVNIRILLSNNKKCLAPDCTNNPKRINVSVEDGVIVEIIGRG